MKKKELLFQRILEERFLEICKDCDLKSRPEQTSAITFLHDLGLVLHFDKVKQYDYYVLDPYWITYGVYQILNSYCSIWSSSSMSAATGSDV